MFMWFLLKRFSNEEVINYLNAIYNFSHITFVTFFTLKQFYKDIK